MVDEEIRGPVRRFLDSRQPLDHGWVRKAKTVSKWVVRKSRELVSQAYMMRYPDATEGVDLFTPRKTKTQVREESLAEALISADLREYLLNEGCLGGLFEATVGALVRDVVLRQAALRDRVVGIYHGVELYHVDGDSDPVTKEGEGGASCRSISPKRSDIPIAEVDTLVLFRSGDIVCIEAKAHYRSTASGKGSDAKDLRSRVKALGDSTGAYTEYLLVFPFIEEELEQLLSGASTSAGTKHVHNRPAWSRQLNAYRQIQRIRLLGLDRLEKTLVRYANQF